MNFPDSTLAADCNTRCRTSPILPAALADMTDLDEGLDYFQVQGAAARAKLEADFVLAAARVAPEKAVFRPALPTRPLAGLIGQHMAKKLTYGEQLKHPNWQRKRLEMLQMAAFECEVCEARDKILHVHHRRYIKGRMAWDYEDADLQVLCETCHQEMHAEREHLESEIAKLHHSEVRFFHGVMVGYRGGIVGDHGYPDSMADAVLLDDEGHKGFSAGAFLKTCDDLDIYDLIQLDTLLRKLNPDGFRDAISDALARVRRVAGEGAVE